jgi:hypothetical protein
MRRVLLISYYFPPSAAVGGLRILGFVQHLPKFGWNTAVVAPSWLPFEPSDPTLVPGIPLETPVFGSPYPVPPFNKPLRLWFPYLVWLPAGWQATRRAMAALKPDVILTSGPPHCLHLLGLAVKIRKRRIPWIVDFRDPWVHDRCQVWPHSQSGWGEKSLEKVVLRMADAIILNTPQACQSLQGAYPAYATKMTFVMNGFDPTSPPGKVSPLLVPDRINIVHPGSVYGSRNPGPFLDALKECLAVPTAGLPPLRVLFLGEELALALEAQKRGLEDQVHTIQAIPHAKALQVMEDADILLLLDSPGRRRGVPAKLFEYLNAGRPILALAEPDGDVAWVLRESGILFRVASPEDRWSIKRALLELLGESAVRHRQKLHLPKAHRFTRETMAQRLAQILDHLMTERPFFT